MKSTWNDLFVLVGFVTVCYWVGSAAWWVIKACAAYAGILK